MLMQLALVTISLLFFRCLYCLLFLPRRKNGVLSHWDPLALGQPATQFWLACLLECAFVCMFFYQTSHFAIFGYKLLLGPALTVFGLALGGVGFAARAYDRIRARTMLLVFLGTYAAGLIMSIVSFPLSYLRSDMLPVIFWADRALLAGQNPYQTFHVADRLYDFPYLPGMLLAFAPAQALHLDLRWASLTYMLAGMGLIYWAARVEFRTKVTALLGLFLLSPYLQYRHELYTQGHLFSLIVIFVLMQRGRFAWSAVAFGASMMLSQFSWVIFPFFLINALRRKGWREVARVGALATLTSALLFVPFVASGAGQIAHNTVGQWDLLVRPIARPINLSFWASFVVRPNHLKWIQLTILATMFLYCWARGRCADLADMLRWMIAALTVFIVFNVLVDGYFYLMLLVPMLVYTCVANGWWTDRSERGTGSLHPLRHSA